MAMRRLLKERLRTPYAIFLDLVTRWSAGRAGLALVYHRIDHRQQDTESHLVAAIGSGRFEAQLRRLRARYRLVPASELHGAVRARRRGQRMPVAITFDDDLPSHVRAAMPRLASLGIPATFFLSGASLHNPFAFWWERLQSALDDHRVSEQELRAKVSLAATPAGRGGIRGIASKMEVMPREEREEVARWLLQRIGSDPDDAGLRTEDVRALVAAGFEIGFHTRGHDALPQLSDEELERAMSEGRAELEEIAGDKLSLIAYPHGKADSRVAAAARAAGYRFGFTTSPERIADEGDALLMGRLYPSYHSIGRFELEVARTLRASRRS